jgi:hypothetical protein
MMKGFKVALLVFLLFLSGQVFAEDNCTQFDLYPWPSAKADISETMHVTSVSYTGSYFELYGTGNLSVLVNGATVVSWPLSAGTHTLDLQQDVDFTVYPGDTVKMGVDVTFTVIGGGDPFILTFCETSSTEFKPDIKANGSDGPIILSSGDAVSITMSIQAGDQAGQVVDWWVAVNTPFAAPGNWYSYVSEAGWQAGINLYAQQALISLASQEILNMVLPIGEYTFYLAFDAPDNAATGPWIGIDAVKVTVTDTISSVIGNWYMHYDWECDGSSRTSSDTFYSDGTFKSVESLYGTTFTSTGTWSQVGNEVTFLYASGTTYIGTISPDGEYMEGTVSAPDGDSGCWQAERK